MSSTSKIRNITVEKLYERLDVDFWAGKLYYKPIGLSYWDTRNSGRECFNIRCNKYLAGTVDGVRLYKHRVILAMYLMRWPEQVDHIDGDTHNNKIANLREADQSENRKNCARHTKNTSGFNGVTWSSQCNKWLVRVCVNYKEMNLGLYEDKEEAIKVRKEADKKYGFHENHGRESKTEV